MGKRGKGEQFDLDLEGYYQCVFPLDMPFRFESAASIHTLYVTMCLVECVHPTYTLRFARFVRF
jgi:hypothetical protein